MDIIYYNSYQELSTLTDDFAISFSLPAPHNLVTSLKVPINPQIDEEFLINATHSIILDKLGHQN
jgi:hypothetical protein